MTRVLLSEDLRTQILAEASAALPNECCGLLEGLREGEDFRVTAVHRVRNIAASRDRFDMAPEDQFAAHRRARDHGHAIVGCYHSHPNGHPQPSEADHAGAGEEHFLWLIAAGGGLNAFVYLRGIFVGADWVTSSE